MARRKTASKTLSRPRAAESVTELMSRLSDAFPEEDLSAAARRARPVDLEVPAVRASASDAELIATARIYALRVFLARGGHTSLAQARDALGLSDQELWDRALDAAGLPPAPLPDHIHLPG